MAEENQNLSIPELVAKIKRFASVFKRNKWLLVLGIVIGISLGVIKKFTAKVAYTAEISFILDGGSAGKASGLMGLAAQFGLGGGISGMNEDKLFSIAKSKTVITNALLTKSTVNGKSDLNINHYLNEAYGKKYKEKGLKLVLVEHSKSNEMTYKEDSVMNFASSLFAKGLLVFVKSKEGVITTSLTFSNEEFAKNFINDLSVSLIAFFNMQSTEKEKISVDLLQEKCDSLYTALVAKERRLAGISDGSQRMFKLSDRMPEMELQREVKILNIMYAEALKNLEVVKFDLLYNTPIIQIIDKPVLPLPKMKTSLLVSVVGGAFFGGFLTTIFIFLRIFYKKYWKA